MVLSCNQIYPNITSYFVLEGSLFCGYCFFIVYLRRSAILLLCYFCYFAIFMVFLGGVLCCFYCILLFHSLYLGGVLFCYSYFAIFLVYFQVFPCSHHTLSRLQIAYRCAEDAYIEHAMSLDLNVHTLLIVITVVRIQFIAKQQLEHAMEYKACIQS